MRFGQLQIVTSALEPDEQIAGVDMLGICLDAYTAKVRWRLSNKFVIETYSNVQF